ncbi:MAG: DUF3987 domain-containing protein [Anaerolineae bacterium]|nr:DUF3987 domain-containing protein [Anaerolineae bacterium]
MITLQDAWAIKRRMVGLDLNGSADLLSPMVSALLSSIDTTTPDGFKLLQKIAASDPSISQLVLAADPHKPAPQKAALPEVFVPPLHKSAVLTDEARQAAETSGRWLSEFSAWAIKRSPMTPPIMLEAGGIWLIGLATARRAYVQMHERIYPHLYIMWVAMTTRYAKSTGFHAVQAVAMHAFPYLIMPSESTPEALMSSLAGKMPDNFNDLPKFEKRLLEASRSYAAQRGMMIDEASSLLGASKKDYMQGLAEMLLLGYDAPARLTRATKSGGYAAVYNLGLSILGATTPAAMARYVGPDRWEDGDMARYALLFPEGPMPYTDDIGDYLPPMDVVEQVKALHNRLPTPPSEDLYEVDTPPTPETIALQMDESARAAFRKYRKAMVEAVDRDLDVRLHGNYGRLPIMAVKVALSLALIDWAQQAKGNPPTIQIGHWARAQMIVESWRGSLHRLLDALAQTRDSRAQDRILVLLKYSPTGLTIRDLSRSTGLRSKEIEDAMGVLIESGDVQAIDHQNPNGGHKTRLYQRVVSAN